jgi:hypothetical protein
MADGTPPPQDETMAAKIDHMSAGIDRQSAEEKAKLDALRTFYASLNPDQRARFDALDRLRHAHDHMGMHGGHEHGDHGGRPMG